MVNSQGFLKKVELGQAKHLLRYKNKDFKWI